GSSSGAPQVLALRSIRARRKGLTAVVVRFDRPMDSARVQDTGLYHLVMVPRGEKARVKAGRLASAPHDASNPSLMLAPSKPVKTGMLRLTIDRSGAVAADGIGLSGGDYVARVPK